MPDFAYAMAGTFYWLGAFQPHCGDSGEPDCADTWTGWDWVDNTPNGNLDCDPGSDPQCGKS
jgi:hypothetical protein